jgi:hypothetical protein
MNEQNPFQPKRPGAPQEPLSREAEQAKKLIRLSRILAITGAILWIPGACTIAMVFEVPVAGYAVGGLGFVVLVVGAIIGQVGRGMQGRVM